MKACYGTTALTSHMILFWEGRCISTYYYHLDAFDKIIHNNRSTLLSFSVKIEMNVPLSHVYVGEMIEKLLQCMVLEEVTFQEVPTQSVMETLRPRGVLFRKYLRCSDSFETSKNC